MHVEVKIRKAGAIGAFRTHLVDAPSVTKAIVESIEREMLANDEPIICSAVVPLDDYEFNMRIL